MPRACLSCLGLPGHSTGQSYPVWTSSCDALNFAPWSSDRMHSVNEIWQLTTVTGLSKKHHLTKYLSLLLRDQPKKLSNRKTSQLAVNETTARQISPSYETVVFLTKPVPYLGPMAQHLFFLGIVIHKNPPNSPKHQIFTYFLLLWWLWVNKTKPRSLQTLPLLAWHSLLLLALQKTLQGTSLCHPLARNSSDNLHTAWEG